MDFSKIKIANFLFVIKEEFLKSYRLFNSYKFTKIYIIIIGILNLIEWGFAWFTFSSLSPEARALTALHYNVDFGLNINLVGHAERIFLIPLLGLIIFALNTNLSLILFRYERRPAVIGHTMMLSSLVVNIFLLLSLFSLYLINFY